MQTNGYEIFHDSVVRDPLFAAEGMDIERSLLGLDELERAIKEVERESCEGSIMRKLFIARYPIAKHALPIPFLRSFVDCEHARREYLLKPTIQSATFLASSWKKSADLFAACVKRYIALHGMFRDLEKMNDSYVFEDRFGNASSATYIQDSLDSLMRNAQALRTEAEERLLVLTTNKKGINALHSTSVFEPLVATDGECTDESSRIHALELQYGTPFRDVEILEKFGPFRYVLSSFEGTPTPHDFMLYITRDKKTARVGMEVSRIDHFIFYELADKYNFRFNDISTANYKTLIDRGIPYWYESSTHLYTMRDQRYWMDIATIADMKRRPELNAAYLNTQRSSTFDLLLDVFVRHAHFNIGYARRRKFNGTGSSYSPYRGLLNHSYPSLYFLTFNRSVWRLPEEPQFIGDSRVDIAGRPYRPSSEVLPKLAPGMLEKVMQGSKIRIEEETAKGIIPREEY